MAKMTVTFSLDTERDKRLVRWLDNLPEGGRSAAIREALAAHLGQNGVTLRDIYEAIQELRQVGVAVRAQADEPQVVPADVLENLSKLGL